MEHYYDILYKEEFHHLFGDLYIGRHPTAQKNHLFVLSLDFTTTGKYNEMMGFTETEVKGILQTLELETKISIEDLKRYSNGYLFNIKADKRVYNPDMILYYLTRWKERAEPPEEIVDENVKTDYGRLQRLIKNAKNKDQLHLIIQEEKIKGTLEKRFSFDLMYEQKYFKVVLFAFLSLNPVYRLQSEPEVGGGFIDIYLERDNRFFDVRFEWIWELKYIKKNQPLEDVKTKGLEQLNRYATSPRFRGKKNLKKALLIFRGKDECFVYEV